MMRSLGGLICLLSVSLPSPAAPSFSVTVQPFLKRYCLGCHSAKAHVGGLNLEADKSLNAVLQNRERWENVVQRIKRGDMPPKGLKRLEASEVQEVTAFLEAQFDEADRRVKPDHGRVTVRRLNRYEYNATIRDLLGVDFQPAADFPADDVGYGFDNIGDVLSLSPVLMDQYLGAAEKIAAKATGQKKMPACAEQTPECARGIVGVLARRAYRRPVSSEEIDGLMRFYAMARKDGRTHEQGIQLAIEAMLVSPHFLFRIEPNPKPGVHEVSEIELASRLSYFLWSSMPDEELLSLAEKNSLRGALEAQVRRMLQDQKAKALAENFASQWLQFRNLDSISPDPDKFPQFDNELRLAMKQETEQFFLAFLREDLPVSSFLDADFTFLNERLAKHYGIDGVRGPELRKVQLTDPRRGGILTQASVLTVSSYPNRTSPVIRGKWVLENLLNAAPPPPPANVPSLDVAGVGTKVSLRQQLEKHRENAVCASCHNRMDPLGFGLENFDATGAWRTSDGSFPIDASGVMPDGRKFTGPVELKAVLKADSDAFRRCLVEKLLTFALGRGLERYDRPAVKEIWRQSVAHGDTLASVILEITKSPPFQMRRGEVEQSK